MDPQLSDWTTSQGPDEGRLAALIAAHDRDLRRVAVAITDDAARADAAVRATWAKARRRMSGLRGRSETRAWLLRRLAREAARRIGPSWIGRVRGRIPLIGRPPPPPEPGPDVVLARVLASLNLEDRLMLALRLALGLTTEEIAAQLDLTGAGVRTHLADLREGLRAGLGIGEQDEQGLPRSDREIEQTLAARLVAHLDRRATKSSPEPASDPGQTTAPLPEATVAARTILRETRPGRGISRPLLVGGVLVLAILLVAVPLGLGLGGAGESIAPTPVPGSFVSFSGWTQRIVATANDTLRVLGWAPDGGHVAVASVGTRQVTIYDRSGAPQRSFPGNDAAWLDSDRLLVLEQLNGSAVGGSSFSNLVVRSLDGRDDLLVSLGNLGQVSALTARGGAVAVLLDGQNSPAVRQLGQGLSFSILRSSAFSGPVPGIPLAWTPDGTRLAYLADPIPVAGGYRGFLHVIDAATLRDHDLGTGVQSAVTPAQIDPSGSHLLACIPSETSASACHLGIVALADGTAEITLLPGTTAAATWAPDGSVVAERAGTILRWGPGDAPVALAWRSDGVTVLSMAAVGDELAIGLLRGPPGPRRVAGVSPPLVAVPGETVRSMAGSPDGDRLAFVQLHAGSSTLVLATLAPVTPPGPSPSAGGSAAPRRSLQGTPILAPPAQAFAENVAFDSLYGVWGPRVYLGTGGYAGGPSPDSFVPLALSVMDITSGGRTAIDAPVNAPEQVLGLATDGSQLVLETYVPPKMGGSTGACPPEALTPEHWRILAAPLGPDGVPTGPFAVLAAGNAARAVTPAVPTLIGCPGVQVPIMAVDQGHIAYAVEAPTTTNRWASRLVVRDLSDGTILRDETTMAPVSWIGLDGETLAWSEIADRSEAHAVPLTLHAATGLGVPAHAIQVPHGAATPVSGWFSLDRGSLLYDVPDDASGMTSVWRLDLASGTPDELTVPGDSCNVQAVGEGVAFLRCWAADTTFVSVWRPETPVVAVEFDGQADNPFFGAYLGGGWAIILSDSSTGPSGPRLTGYLLEDLRP